MSLKLIKQCKSSNLASNSSKKEQAYIQALSTRYVRQPLEDRSSLDRAYAKAMKKVGSSLSRRHRCSYSLCRSIMDTMPWDYWTEAGEPKPVTKELLSYSRINFRTRTLSSWCQSSLYSCSRSCKPEKAIAAADRLRNLVPGSGHLVHMPSHIYIRVGRYRDAAIANEKAIAVDRDYLTQCHAQGLYPLAYVPHNQHFLWFSAMFEGDSKLAIKSANRLAEMIDKDRMREPGFGTLQHFYSIPLYTLIRFGKWEEILTQPQPAQDLEISY